MKFICALPDAVRCNVPWIGDDTRQNGRETEKQAELEKARKFIDKISYWS